MSKAPTTYSGVVHNNARRRLSWNSVDRPPTIGAPRNATAITMLEMPDACSRSATGVTSSSIANGGPAGRAGSIAPTHTNGAATHRVVGGHAAARAVAPT